MSTRDAAKLDATTFRLHQLVEQVEVGRIRIPRFQRVWRWDAGDVRDLFDSVYRGFPIGTLLFWAREAKAGEIDLANGLVKFQVDGRHDALWVVDGQQRITALSLAVLHDLFGGPVDRKFQVVFDLETELFTTASRGRSEGTHLPVNVAFDLSKILVWSRDRQLTAAHQARAFALTQRLRDYEVPAYLVHGDDDAVLREVFDRMNTFGKRMRRSEVFHALHSGIEGTSDPSDLRQLAEALSSTGFGEIGDDLTLLLTLAVRGGDVLRDFRDEFKDDGPDEPAETFRRTETAFALAVAFLRQDARIPNVRVLPYEYILVALAAFFARHPEPAPRNRVRLRRWVWRTAVAGPTSLGGYTPTLRRSAAAAGGDGDESTVVEHLLEVTGPQPASELKPNTLRLNIATNRMAVAALLALRPRDPRDGTELDLGQLFGDGLPSVARLYDRTTLGDEWLQLGNVVFTSAGFPDPDDRFREALAHASEEVLASHAIDGELVDLLKTGDPALVEARQAHIVKLTNETAAALAEWGRPDRRSLDEAAPAEEPW